MNETGQLNRVDQQPLVRLPNVALTIKQPWAELIAHGFKDIENRSWPTKFRGWVLIHASKRDDQDEWDSARSLIQSRKILIGRSSEKFGRGGVVGVARIVDCVRESSSPWFVGEFGFVLADASPLPFFACRGALGFWRCEYPEALLSETNVPAVATSGLVLRSRTTKQR